ncbi:MAG TPA: type III secretion system chaperone [Verrucomicrobium sp.]|nr:type III secretion system chaperone [Verrucomicrobium sp.]
MEFPLLLQYLGGLLGMGDLALNDNGVLSLQFGDAIVIHLEPDPDGIRGHLYGSFGPAPSDPVERARLFEALLSANCFGRGTEGATFSLDEHEQELLLGRIFICEETEPQVLFSWIKDIVGSLDVWKGRRLELLDPASPCLEEGFKPFTAGSGADHYFRA